jgi:hypothetical protein
MYARNQVGLELVQVDVQRTVETQRSSDGGDNLGDKPVEVGERRRSDAQVSTADIINPVYQCGRLARLRLVVNHERTVGVLQGGVSGENRVVRFDNRSRHLGGWVD